MSANRNFQMGDSEWDAAEIFIVEHTCTAQHQVAYHRDVVGGTISYRFTPTGIGLGITVSCSCGADEDVTDYGSW